MNEEHLGSIAAFAARLAPHLGGLRGRSEALPDAGELERLIELAFFAGLNEDEGRRSEVTLAWTGGTHHCRTAMAFRSPVLATPKSVARLAPVADRDATSLALRRDGNDLVVWALLQHEPLQHDGPAGLPLMIRVVRPGVLRVDHGGVPCALYVRGESLFLGEPGAVKSPARRLTETFTSWAASDQVSSGIDPRAATVTRIAARTLSYGHGGMILLLPASSQPVGVRMHYEAAHGTDMLARHYAALMEGVAPRDRLARIGSPDPRDRAQARFEQTIDFVASLTRTDNALLLDTDLNIRSFGVQVIEGEAPLQSFAHISPYGDDSHVDDISTFKGTRHPAGVIFCLRQQGEAAAIIASQDSRLSLVSKDARGTVEVLGSYEHGFGWR